METWKTTDAEKPRQSVEIRPTQDMWLSIQDAGDRPGHWVYFSVSCGTHLDGRDITGCKRALLEFAENKLSECLDELRKLKSEASQ